METVAAVVGFSPGHHHHPSCFLLMLVSIFGIATAAVPITTTTTPLPGHTTPVYTTPVYTTLVAPTVGNMTTQDTADTISTSTEQSSSPAPNISLPNISSQTDPPAIVNNENVTETEIIITEARHGKSLHHHNNNHQQQHATNQQQQQEDLIAKSNDESSGSNSTNGMTSTEKSVTELGSGASDFEVKLATDGDHEVQQLSQDDAPPEPTSELPKPVGKPPKPAVKRPIARPQKVEPRFLFVTTTPAAATERDRAIQRIFGGSCGADHWHRCSRLEFWADEYLVADKLNPGSFIKKQYRINCREKPTYCLKNGWTVSRCHMLCMSHCNQEFRMDFEKHVLHEGDCKWPLLKGISLG